MRNNTTLRWAIAAALIALTASAVPAGAVEGEKITIRIDNNEKVSKKYPQMLVSDTAGEFTGDPEMCAEVPFCTLVPLEVLLRDDFNPDINEFVLTVRLGWDDRGVTVQGQGAQGNDLDMYIYVKEKNAKGATVYREVGRSAGSKQPEVAKLFTPSVKDYYIVVYNWVGVNNGFDMTVSYRDASIEELGEFEGAGGPMRPGSGSDSASGDFGGDFGGGGDSFEPESSRPTRPVFSSPSRLPSAPDGFSSTGSSAPGVLAAPIGVEDASVFDLPGGSGRDLASDLAPNETQDVFKPRVASGNPEPASGVLLGFWLGVVPLVLMAAAAVVMMRRRPAALTLSLPKPSTA